MKTSSPTTNSVLKLIALSAMLLFFSGFCNAQQLVYKPINPAFGGDTFNHQWLQSSAQAQNGFEDEDLTDRFGGGLGTQSGLDQVGQSLNNQLLSQLTSNIFQNTFGESGLQPGNYSFGNLSISVTPSTQGLSVRIIDIGTGESTTIIVPYY